MAAGEQRSTAKISSSTNSTRRPVTPFWKEKYERDARRYWDIFYKGNEDMFFKDRHYLDKEWGKYFEVQDGENMAILLDASTEGRPAVKLDSRIIELYKEACWSAISWYGTGTCKGIVLLDISIRTLYINKQPWLGRSFIRSFQNLLRGDRR